MKKGYSNAIFSIFGQILLMIILMVGSYFIFTGSRLASYASVANAFGNANYDLQVVYGKDQTIVENNEEILDKGILSVRNPNSHAVTANVNFKISNYVDLNTVNVIINNQKLDTTNYLIKDNYYIIPVEQYELASYEQKEYDTVIEGNPYFEQAFYYNYDVTESFYN